MDVSQLDYFLPPELIAQEPPPRRADARMLVVDRARGALHDRRFEELPDLLAPSDLLVLNDSRVFPARLLGRGESGGAVEVLLLRPLDPPRPPPSAAAGAQAACWEALGRPGRRLRPGGRLAFGPGLSGVVLDPEPGAGAGRLRLRLQFQGDLSARLRESGHVPLPPYIRRPDSAADRERYQTVYARADGSVAAPTAGLHFTGEILRRLGQAGIAHCFLTLHVGYGTFRPVTAPCMEQHRLDPERFEVPPATAAAIRAGVAAGRRILAVGTTTTRVLEAWCRLSPGLESASGETDLLIVPPFAFGMVGGLLTNFHLPRSSLLALVCAFLGTDLALACYAHAVSRRYRFYSYGDCMLIL